MTEMFNNMSEYFKDNTNILETINLVRERYSYIGNDSDLQKEFEFFKEKNYDSLEKEFLQRNEFRTSIRGIKVRGSYDTLEEAKLRVEQIRKFDKNFNVYVAEVGCWCPWSPNPNILEDQEYCETSLNSLVKNYQENESIKNDVYQKRKDDMMDKIKEEMEKRKDTWLSTKTDADNDSTPVDNDSTPVDNESTPVDNETNI